MSTTAGSSKCCVAFAHMSGWRNGYMCIEQVAGGNGEQAISRDIYRLGTRMDFFRLMSFYQTGPGFFGNAYLVLLGVYSTVWAFLLITVVGAQRLDLGDGNLFSTISGACSA